MKKIKKLIAFISMFAIGLNTLLPAFAGDIPFNFDNNNTSNIYAFSGTTTPNYLNGANLDLTKSNTNLLRWRGNGNGWGIDSGEKGNDKLEINTNEAIGFNIGTGTTVSSFNIKHDKDNKHNYENFVFKAFASNYTPVTINTSFDSHDQAKTKVIIKSASQYQYVVMIGSTDGLNILSDSDITTGCNGGSTVTNLTKKGFPISSYMSGTYLNFGQTSLAFGGSQNNPIDWGIQTLSSDKARVDPNEVFALDFATTTVKSNVFIKDLDSKGTSIGVNVKAFDENLNEITGISKTITTSTNPVSGSLKITITAPQAFRYITLNPVDSTNKFSVFDTIDVYDYSCGKMTNDFRAQNQNGPLNEPGDQVKYLIEIGNPGNVDLTGINVTANIPSQFINLGNITLPAGATNNSNTNTLSISGVNVPIGGTGVITYTVNVDSLVSGDIPTLINVSNSNEGVNGGSGTIIFKVGTPSISSSITSLDINGGDLVSGDIVSNTGTITNTGTAVGNDVNVSINYSSGTTFQTGSLNFKDASLDGSIRGSSIISSSIIINDTNKTISFTIKDLPVNEPEIINFNTIVIGTGSIINTMNLNMEGGFTQSGSNTPIVITNTNSNPTANNDTVSTNEDNSININVLANDSDIDNNSLSITSITGATNGTTQISGTGVLFTPSYNFYGTGSFIYSISDGNGGNASATAYISINPINDNPIANNDSAVTQTNGNVTIKVLDNDNDIENNTLSISSVTNELNGTAQISGTGIIFSPSTNFVGTGSFTYTISDGNGGTASATVSINVTNSPYINISTISSDDVINMIEHNQNLTISGTTLNVEDGNIVSITLNSNTYTGSVLEGKYSVNISSINVNNLNNDTTYTVSANVSNNLDINAPEYNKNINVKLTAPIVKILSPISGSIMISDNISGTGANIGDTIYVTGTTNTSNVFNCNTIVSSTGSWTCNLGIGTSHDGKIISINAREYDVYGNYGDDNSYGITIKLTPPPINNNNFNINSQIKLGTGNVIEIESNCTGSGTYIDVYNVNMIPNPTTYTCTGEGDVLIPLHMNEGLEGTIQEFKVKRRDNFGNVIEGDTKSVGLDDLDGIDKNIEDGNPNGGDGNGDGILDSRQPNVTSIINIKKSTYNSLYITGSTCRYVSKFENIHENNLLVQDPLNRKYPLGLWNINIECINPGDTANVSIYLDDIYDTTGWIYRKYNESTKVYTDISNIINYTTENIGTKQVTVINYNITDGGILDDDGIANRFIIDPAGPTIVSTTNNNSTPSIQSNGGGGSNNSKLLVINNEQNKIELNSTNNEENIKLNSAEEIVDENIFPNTMVENMKNTFKTMKIDYQTYKNKYNNTNIINGKSGYSLLNNFPKILPKTGTDISKKVKTIIKEKIETKLPDWIINDTSTKNDDISFWLNKIPYEQDKNENEYIVLPSIGMIMPIKNVENTSIDYDKLINGNEIEFNNYLKNGAMKYPGTSSNGYGELGNTVIFGHSSYFKKDDGRYKTAFQTIIGLDQNDEVWIYKKDNSNSKYKLYKYSVEKSYETKASDTSILGATDEKNITLFTCTPIGGIEGRWVVKAKYIENNIIINNNVSNNTKVLTSKVIKKLSKLEIKKRKQSIIYLYNILLGNSEKKLNIKNEEDLDYIKYELLKKYFN